MAELLRLCGIAVLCAVMGAVLGRAVGGTAVAVRLAGLCLVIGGGVSVLGEVVSALGELGVGESVSEYSALMLRGLGLAVLCRVCSDVCRDCGEPTVASAVETAGKLSILLLAMPTVSDIVAAAGELMEKI